MRTRYLCLLLLGCTLLRSMAADEPLPEPIPAALLRNSPAVLSAFTSITEPARRSVVSLQTDNKDLALGTIITAEGLVITKASEVGRGKLVAHFWDGRQVEAKVLATDEDNDVALLSVAAHGLTPIAWDDEGVNLGQWAITPGIQATPAAVGIVSAAARRILPTRAVIGVIPDFNSSTARIRQLMPGLGAEKAGVKPGDVILAVNDLPIKDGEALVQTLSTFREGQTVKLRLSRDSQELELSVLMQLPPPERSGRGFERQQRMNRLGGELSRRAEGFQLAIQHDGVLQPWQCGGPLLDVDGKAVGLNIARAGRIASYALPAALVLRVIENLERAMEVPVDDDHELEVH